MTATDHLLAAHRQASVDGILLEGPDGAVYDHAAVGAALDALASLFVPYRGRAVAVMGDNTPAWALVDLALLATGCCSLPLPDFFSEAQLSHALTASGCALIVCRSSERLDRILGHEVRRQTLHIAGEKWTALHMAQAGAVALPEGTAKITFTSGSTGQPKGVCLSAQAMMDVAASLAEASSCTPRSRHLCTLPLATLLENIAGVYAPLLSGARVLLKSCAAAGLTGSSGFDAGTCMRTIADSGATRLILVPAMLQALMASTADQEQCLRTLEFVAVGGAPVPNACVDAARAAGWPIYVGYGLSECCSVLCLNTPQHDRAGSVGRPLAHVSLRITDAGEIEAAGSPFLGYLGDTNFAGDWVATGDLGHRDADGYVFVHGRRKHLFVTSYGRNVSPEWVESTLQQEPAISQAVVFGENRPWNIAVLVPETQAGAAALRAAVARVNAQLPDYARIGDWIAAPEAMSAANGLMTATGKPLRTAIAARFGDAIEARYAGHDVLTQPQPESLSP
ncbi:AMP-binding protein [Algiphilus aromaticivorans]|uniref:AMP-binding protein n=1 Tax=Algiphilus aromaticivorans TaxID=382454 RepID=UPI0006936EB9|nr:AMP-binding protein [Algiphilus aromaticivorans]